MVGGTRFCAAPGRRPLEPGGVFPCVMLDQPREQLGAGLTDRIPVPLVGGLDLSVGQPAAVALAAVAHDAALFAGDLNVAGGSLARRASMLSRRISVFLPSLIARYSPRASRL
jgi:hypothetical protein